MAAKEQFWHGFLRAVETDVRPAQTVRGASGFTHPILAVGVDESRKRTVIISGEPDARTTALAQADIQAAMDGTKVVMARPVPINLRLVAQFLQKELGSTRFALTPAKPVTGRGKRLRKNSTGNEAFSPELSERIKSEILERGALPFLNAELNTHSVWKELIYQLSFLQFEGFDTYVAEGGLKQVPAIMFEQLLSFDPVAIDRSSGVCAVPLYELQEGDYELVASGKSEETKELLARHHVLQYFFPPADQIALATVEQGVTERADVTRRVELASELGHPLAPNELVAMNTKMNELVDELLRKGFLVEGTASMEMSKTGSAVRAEIKYRPREGFLKKLSRVLSMKVDLSLKDVFKP